VWESGTLCSICNEPERVNLSSHACWGHLLVKSSQFKGREAAPVDVFEEQMDRVGREEEVRGTSKVTSHMLSPGVTCVSGKWGPRGF
jgi:hypothetical protein